MPELIGGFLRYQIQFTDDGWGGYGSLSDQQLDFFYLAPNMTNETAIATTQAWHNYTHSLAPFGIVSQEQIYYAPSFYELYQFLYGSGVQNGLNLMFTSRLLSRDTVANRYTEVAEVLIDCDASFKYVLQPSSIWSGCRFGFHAVQSQVARSASSLLTLLG